MFSVISHQENTNKNNEIKPTTKAAMKKSDKY